MAVFEEGPPFLNGRCVVIMLLASSCECDIVEKI